MLMSDFFFFWGGGRERFLSLKSVVLKARPHDAILHPTLCAIGRLHRVAASETVARNVACNVSGVDFHSTSTTLPATISSCVHPLKLPCDRSRNLSDYQPITFYSQDENPLTTKTTVKKWWLTRLLLV